ncbi:MAG: hypothetical protein GTO42_02305 [Candidatus Latescibacteria bacterium]|nr:hypothetical protein [Candidatus Latescibacterota bacterium]NIO00968.1 hypothetical protein [Candidatus Latescibacterota bacterium]NIO27367.1 hypothetical protein [Candidatus Latescibacterota bacterium]NIO54889.1 hypothetical protein [Candidatus Latescibacterota bacterium]NIT00978.1 hypothetical protein [Candidatus Latescibacterota bacterium]
MSQSDQHDNSCEWALERLEAHLDGELPADEAQAIEVHLKSCHLCAQEWALAGQVKKALGSLPQKTCPDRVLEAVLEGIAEDAGTARRPAGLWPARLRWGILRPATIATALIVVLALTVFISRQGRLPVLPDEKTEEMEEISPEAVAIAKEEVKWTFAYIGDIGRRAGLAVRDDAIYPHVVTPVQHAVDEAIYPRVVAPVQHAVKEAFDGRKPDRRSR